MQGDATILVNVNKLFLSGVGEAGKRAEVDRVRLEYLRRMGQRTPIRPVTSNNEIR